MQRAAPVRNGVSRPEPVEAIPRPATRPSRIGISGWTYPPWRGTFYPPKLPHKRELAYAASTARLDRGQRDLLRAAASPTRSGRWVADTPDGFVFAVKGSRFITHMKKLADADTTLANFFASGVLALGDRLGPLPVAAATDPGLRRRPAGRLLQPAAADPGRGRRPGRPARPPDHRRPRAGDDRIARTIRSGTRSRSGTTASVRPRSATCSASTTSPWSGPTTPGKLADPGRDHHRLPLRPAARRHRAVRQRLLRRGARSVGVPDPRLGRRRSGRVRLLRQRREGAGPVRRHGSDGPPRPGQAGALIGGPRRTKKSPAHPKELTYPCCLPTLGELGEVSPRGGPATSVQIGRPAAGRPRAARLRRRPSSPGR